MSFVRHFVVFSFLFSSFQPLLADTQPTTAQELIKGAEIPASSIETQQHGARDKKEEAFRFESSIAELACRTHEFIEQYLMFEKHKDTKRFKYLTFKETSTKQVIKLKQCFYSDTHGIYNVCNQYRISLEKGIESAIKLIKRIAKITDTSLPKIKGNSREKRIDWLEKTVEQLSNPEKGVFHKKVGPKSIYESWQQWIGNFLLNDLLDFNYTSMAEGMAFLLGLVGPYQIGCAINQEGRQVRESDAVLAVTYLLVAATINKIGKKIDEYKQTLKNNETQRKKLEKMQRMNKKNPFELIHYYAQPDVGASMIAGVQSPEALELVERLTIWLTSPLKFCAKDESPEFSVIAYGEPGNGKAEIVKAIANESDVDVLAVTAKDLISLEKGDSNYFKNRLLAAYLLAQQSPHKSIIILFDEIDLAIKGSKNAVVLQELLTMLSGVKNENPFIRMLCVFETNYPDQLDERLMRTGRMKEKLYVGPPNETQRYNLLKMALPNTLKEDEQLIIELTKKTEGFSRSAVHQVIKNGIKESIYLNREVTLDDFLACIEKTKQTDFIKGSQIA